MRFRSMLARQPRAGGEMRADGIPIYVCVLLSPRRLSLIVSDRTNGDGVELIYCMEIENGQVWARGDFGEMVVG